MQPVEVRQLIASVTRSPQGNAAGPALRALAAASQAGGRLRRLVGVEVDNCVSKAIASAWQRGWQPADVVRLVERTLNPPHRRFCIDAIAREAGSYSAAVVDPRWRSQLDSLGALYWWNGGESHLWQWADREELPDISALRCALAVMSVVVALPPLPRLCDPPGEWRPLSGAGDGGRLGADGSRMLEKVRALLAKAESTTFAAEAEALTAKAQQLISRYSIDAAMLTARSNRHTESSPGGVRIPVDNPYASAKSMLLGTVAHANNCRSLWSKHFGFSTVIGYEADLAAVEVLYTSLLVQASSAMVAAGPQSDWRGRSRTRSFRQSFLVAYSIRIGERLRSSAEAASASATGRYGPALLPVLVSRIEEVEKVVDTLFPCLARTSSSVTNRDGYQAGRAAADLAWLSPRREVRART